MQMAKQCCIAIVDLLTQPRYVQPAQDSATVHAQQKLQGASGIKKDSCLEPRHIKLIPGWLSPEDPMLLQRILAHIMRISSRLR